TRVVMYAYQIQLAEPPQARHCALQRMLDALYGAVRRRPICLLLFVLSLLCRPIVLDLSLFFFSSRRRHTRCYRDWSSDVCSSDLRLERAFQQPDLPLVDRPQPLGGQFLLDVKCKHRGAAVVRHRIVGRAREARRTAAVLDAIARTALLEAGELAEPAGEDRTKMAAWRHAQKTISLAELTVLIAAAGDERVLQAQPSDIERHHVQVMVRIDEQRHAMSIARARHDVEVGNDLGRLEQH